MKNFLKENWFKIAVLLFVIGFSLLYYFIYFLPKEEKTKLTQEQILRCRNIAEKLYKNEYEFITSKSATSPEYKFIKKDNKCYLVINIDPIIPSPNMLDLFHDESIVDVYENKGVLSSPWFKGISPEQAQSLYGSKTYSEAKEKLFAD